MHKYECPCGYTYDLRIRETCIQCNVIGSNQ
jgi:hypothetical protein